MSLALALLALACTLQTCAAREIIASQDLKSMTPEQLFEIAVKVRSEYSTSWKDQVLVVQRMLIPASGIRLRRNNNTTKASTEEQDDASNGQSIPVPGFPNMAFGPNLHRGALRELGLALQEGYGCDADARLALELLRKAAELGDPAAHGQMGLRYSTGLDDPSSWDANGIVKFGQPNEEEAMLHWYFGALGGDDLSNMILAYRHSSGLGVPKSCATAAAYYLPVAEQVSDLAAERGGPGLPHVERIRLNMHHLMGAKTDRHKEVVQYYQDSADKGNVDAQTAVGQVLNYGTHGVERDHAAALGYLKKAADAGDAQAMAHLANMMANGLDGGEPDYTAAFKYFQRSSDQGNAAGQYGLAYMYLLGQGVAQDHEQAYKLFSQAAGQGHADAHFYLGVMMLKGMGGRRKNFQRAFTCFTMAAHAGNVQAMYNAALMHLTGKGTGKSCKPAVALLKHAAERGPLSAHLQLGHELFFKGQYNQALWNYLIAAATGMELGMSNAAWLLEHGYVRTDGFTNNVTFSLLQRSAAQANVASLLSMGDAYFYGRGVEQNWARAAAIYYEAFQERSAHAMFNLGFMHEFGAGVPKDLVLARRFYDMAKHTTSDATFAAYCARTWLVLHSAWETIRPYLPSRYNHVWDHVWSLRPPHTSVLGSWTAVIAHLLPSQAIMQFELGAWHVLDTLGVTSIVAGFIDEAKESGETAVIIILMALLFVVLRVRRQRVAQHQQAAAQQVHEPVVVQEQQFVIPQASPPPHATSTAAPGDTAATTTAVTQGSSEHSAHGSIQQPEAGSSKAAIREETATLASLQAGADALANVQEANEVTDSQSDTQGETYTPGPRPPKNARDSLGDMCLLPTPPTSGLTQTLPRISEDPLSSQTSIPEKKEAGDQ